MDFSKQYLARGFVSADVVLAPHLASNRPQADATDGSSNCRPGCQIQIEPGETMSDWPPPRRHRARCHLLSIASFDLL